MFVLIGILVVFGSIVAGYLMEHGTLRVLLQFAELLIIGGAAVGTILIANPFYIVKKIISGLLGALKGSKFSKERYLESLTMMYQFLNKARKEGLVGIESDVEDPEKSPIFSKYPKFLGDHHLRDFVCDTMRTAITGGVEPFDIDQMMEVDMEVHHHGTSKSISALSTTADSLPGLGIVAAVLGVVITMGSLGDRPKR
jgi:chemotaxis protein MotA